MAENTDWFMRRKGGFHDQILATNRCLEVGIAPRWQLFLTKRNLHELDEFVRLIDDLNLIKRCERNGQKFEMFIGGISPEGSGYDLEDVRLELDDLGSIPDSLINLSQKGLALLGQPENTLLAELGLEDSPPNMDANIPAVAVNADFDVYPNNAEPTEWWRLGNLKTDGVDAIISAYRDETSPAMLTNRTIPVRELARQYGKPDSKYLYSKDDLICRMMHQCGVDYLAGRR